MGFLSGGVCYGVEYAIFDGVMLASIVWVFHVARGLGSFGELKVEA